MSIACFNIAAVERDTGLSKDVLRVWERRYGFPNPHRDANGERSYPIEQVERLRMIKRLMDQGHRPGKLIETPLAALFELAPRRLREVNISEEADHGGLADFLALIKQHDIAGYQQAMQRQLARNGLQKFVQDTVAPLTCMIGNEWERGALKIFEEHLFTEQTKRLLRQAIASLPGGAHGPCVMLTSVPEEQHILGLLMAEAVFAIEGAECIPLGTEMPLLEIFSAATAHQADIVALSFSMAFPQRKIPALLQQLRQLLPDETCLWAGGSGVNKLPAVGGVQLLPSLEAAQRAVIEWRAARAV